MTSTELKIGLGVNARPSSRVLKPPGGGHTSIFAEPEVSVNAPRAKYNQQNSSNLNACMGSTDPNKKVEKLREDIVCTKEEPAKSATSPTGAKSAKGGVAAAIGGGASAENDTQANARGRVPPGGYSSGGFW